MSDRRAWLDEWSLCCWAAPRARCRQDRYSSRKRLAPAQRMHVARGWRERPCPTCKAASGDRCRRPSGREASQPHTARLRPARGELAARQAVWAELERRGATIAVVAFSGRAGDGGTTGTITLSRLKGDELVDVERSSGPDKLALALALEGPVWDRYGRFAGQPSICGTVTWTVADRRILIAGQRGGDAFEETLT